VTIARRQVETPDARPEPIGAPSAHHDIRRGRGDIARGIGPPADLPLLASLCAPNTGIISTDGCALRNRTPSPRARGSAAEIGSISCLSPGPRGPEINEYKSGPVSDQPRTPRPAVDRRRAPAEST
jgi:hypothetical protein